MNMKKMVGFLLFFIGLLSSCGQPTELPTMVPTASDFILPPTNTPVPTATLEPILPTETPPPTLTPVVPTLESSSIAGPGINITSPVEHTEVAQGSEVTVGGLAQLSPDDKLLVSLVTVSGLRLSEAVAEVHEFNNWQAVLHVPHYASGQAKFQASVLDQSGSVRATDEQQIQLSVNESISDRHLHLFRPVGNEPAVAGYHLFFDGTVLLPTQNLITISIRNESCQKEVARQSFRLRGSGYWQGFVIVPRDITGPVCAVAHFGTIGDADWRQAEAIVEVISADDPNAVGVRIGNPPPESRLTPGQSLLSYGTAYNAPDSTVLISILMENGRLLTEGVTTVDTYGYWEHRLFIPDDASGPVLIEAVVGESDSDDYAKHEIMIDVEEAP